MLRPKNGTIIYFGNDWFAENRTSSHHIARQLSRHFAVLYVDTPGMRGPASNSRDLRKVLRIARKCFGAPARLGPQMWQITVPQIPYRRFPLVEKLNQAFGRWLVKRATRRLGFADSLSWFAVPHPAALAGEVGDQFVVYYCIDDYASLAQMDGERIRRMDEALSRRADLVFVSSRSLLEPKRKLNRNVEYSPHGVDFELFSKAQDPDVEVPLAARDLPHPIIGYFGSIAHHTDLDLIAGLARRRPEWTFLLIGMASVDVRALTSWTNIHLAGAQPYETLPSWAKAFDVAIIPYRSWFAEHSSSLKVREYLAAGKPVVTVSTPEIESYRGLVSIGEGLEEFIIKIEEAIATDSAELRYARQQAIRECSWEACVTRALLRTRDVYSERGLKSLDLSGFGTPDNSALGAPPLV